MLPFLGEKLLKVKTSSFQRPNPKGFKMEVKASGHYVNSILASQEAKANGYDEALLTDINGNVAEGPGANMFFEKNGKLITPAKGNILPGITRATVMEICHELNIPVEERLFTTDEVKDSDAAFFCGTAAEVIGWHSLDDVPFNKPWNESLGRIVQDAYKSKVVKPMVGRYRIGKTNVVMTALGLRLGYQPSGGKNLLDIFFLAAESQMRQFNVNLT
jgi:branched-chain amino acid aminotransferase